MGNFNRNKFGRERGFSTKGRPASGWDRRGSGSGRPSQMFQATCDKCRMNCEVPFRPTNGRPVFCSNCFESNRGSEGQRFSSNSEDRQMFDAVCDECGNSCKVPFQPSSGKPIYCSNCFEGKREGGGKDRNSGNDQFASLHSKLDKILMMLNSHPLAQAAQEELKEEVQGIIPQEPVVNTEIEAKAPKKRSSKKKA